MTSEVTSADTILCIYCRKQRPSSKEHVLQKALGGNFTTQVVCKVCNTGFSTIDQALAEDSLIALKRVGSTPAGKMSVRLGGEHFVHDDERDLWLETSIRNEVQVEIYPQIHVRGAQVAVTGKDRKAFEQFISLIDKRIENGTLHQSHVKVGPPDRCTTTRIVGHRKDDLFVRAASLEVGQDFLRWLVTSWADLKTQLRGQPPAEGSMPAGTGVHVEVAVRLDDNYRAIAKTVFNFMAVRMGSSFALREEFDEIRAYITGERIVHKDPVPEGEIAVDTRFVRALPPGEKPIIPTNSHLVVLSYNPPNLYGSLTLYGDSSFDVHLGKVEINRMVIEAHEFSIDRTENKALDYKEIARRIQDERVVKRTE